MPRVPDIRKSIASAIEQERTSQLFRTKLVERIPQLEKKLQLPDDDPASALIEFVTAYIESVPGSISLVTAVSKKLGFYRYAAPFLHIAEDFFLQPPEDIALVQGLEAVLDEAFLAHRLLEEVNDHHIRNLGRPLLPVDMTEANIIVHHLLGDALATKLESLVQFASSRLLDKEGVWDKVRELPGTTKNIGFGNLSDNSRPQVSLRTNF